MSLWSEYVDKHWCTTAYGAPCHMCKHRKDCDMLEYFDRVSAELGLIK